MQKAMIKEVLATLSDITGQKIKYHTSKSYSEVSVNGKVVFSVDGDESMLELLAIHHFFNKAIKEETGHQAEIVQWKKSTPQTEGRYLVVHRRVTDVPFQVVEAIFSFAHGWRINGLEIDPEMYCKIPSVPTILQYGKEVPEL